MKTTESIYLTLKTNSLQARSATLGLWGRCLTLAWGQVVHDSDTGHLVSALDSCSAEVEFLLYTFDCPAPVPDGWQKSSWNNSEVLPQSVSVIVKVNFRLLWLFLGVINKSRHHLHPSQRGVGREKALHHHGGKKHSHCQK